jgi:hypothetical protein
VHPQYDDDISKARNQKRYHLDATSDAESDTSSHKHVALQDTKKKAVSQPALSFAKQNIKTNIPKRKF